MKISKHLHSCLLVEEQAKIALIDPGIFTYQEKALDLAQIGHLYYLLFTHEHPDHMYIPLVKELVTKFPEVKIITTQSIVDLLQKEHITASSVGDAYISLEPVPHEKLWDTEPPENVSITLFGKVTSPGDALHFKKSAEVLTLPLAAPWESVTDAVKVALNHTPKIIIPAHDWMWKDGFRQTMYQRLQEFFKTKGIDFKAVETGEVVEV